MGANEDWEIGLALTEIYDRVRADSFWDQLRLPGIHLVEGYGAYRPRVLLSGEAPGATENSRLRPFCGASGQALMQLMAVAGLRTEDGSPDGELAANSFITNVVKYRPPGNRTPTGSEIERGRIALRQEWATLGRPKVLVALGGTARSALVPGTTGTLGAGHPVEIGEGVTVWVMYHPAFPLRQRSLRPKVEKHWERFGEWLKENGHVE
jgi:uracil-DNA glycosylase family 4